jgi:hypothetical protein
MEVDLVLALRTLETKSLLIKLRPTILLEPPDHPRSSIAGLVRFP